MEYTQKHINTGKTISDPSDNIAIYFKALSYTSKADNYTDTNAGITQAIANLDYVDKALSNMADNVQGARQMLNDAKAKAVNAATAVNVTGAKAYAQSTVTVGGVTRTIKGQIVDPGTGASASANVADGGFFQAGDVFQVTFRDASNNSTATRYFKAVAPDDANLPDQTKKGDTAANAIEFNDVSSLAMAMNLGFGVANASFGAVATTANGATTYRLSMQLNTSTQSITFGQVADANVTVAGAATKGSTFDFTRLLQPAGQAGATVTTGNALDATNAPNAASWTYSAVGGTQTDQTAVDARKQAADFFRQTVYGLVSTVRDAALPGFANILKGESMTVQLNDTNTVSQTVKLATPIDFTANYGAATYGVGFAINGTGAITTNYTDTASAATSNFLDDAQITGAITKLSTIVTSLSQQRTLVAAAKTAMASRLDLNKTLVSSLKDTANGMTAADMAEESASLAALQNRQNFAATNLTITRQAEQYLLNLLR
ncbi:MAG: hypothetical protein U1E62_08835 [Alsobacter sp.]